MHRIRHKGNPEELLAFVLFFMSNVSAFIAVIWLNPRLVLVEFLLWLILAALSIWFLIKNGLFVKFLESLKRKWIILPFLIFSCLSVIWSVYWEVSIYRWLIFLCTIITGGYIGFRYNIKEIIKILSILGIFILFVSFIIILFIPSIGVMNYHSIHGAWKGVYWHKNHMGLIAAFMSLLFLINAIEAWKSKGKRLLSWGLLYLLSLLFVYQSDSVAAYFTTILLQGMILLISLWFRFKTNLRKIHYWTLVLLLTLASIFLVLNADRFLGIFNRNTSLTGRIPMWTHLFDTYLSQRPVGGYGFNAFWYIDSHRVAMQQAAGYPDPIVISDNGFVDLLINTGMGGIILFSIFYFGIWWHSIKYARKAIDIFGFFPLIVMSYTFVANISWSLIFENESFFLLLMTAILFSVPGRALSSNID
jgi:exopolysaccharide production protein ExoQ